jgi:hypothetical protein
MFLDATLSNVAKFNDVSEILTFSRFKIIPTKKQGGILLALFAGHFLGFLTLKIQAISSCEILNVYHYTSSHRTTQNCS